MNENQDQRQLNGWTDVIQPLMAINKYPRVNWKAILVNKITNRGMSLTQWCARCKAAGLSATQCYNTLIIEYPELSEELRRRAFIGCHARFGESATHIKEYNKVKR